MLNNSCTTLYSPSANLAVIILCNNSTHAPIYVNTIYSHCYTPTCFSSQGAVLRDFDTFREHDLPNMCPRWRAACCVLGGSCQTEFKLYFEAQIIKVELDLGWFEIVILCVYVFGTRLAYSMCTKGDIFSGLSLENFLCWLNSWRLLRPFMCITQSCTTFWIFLPRSCIWSVSACWALLPTLGCHL
jgi:hypothetical protein